MLFFGLDLRFEGERRLAVGPDVEGALTEYRHLHEYRTDQERQAHGALAVPPQEGHQEAETDPYHHVDVLIH